MNEVTAFALEEVLGKGADEISPLLGLSYGLINAVVSEHEKTVRDRARKVIRCVHLEVCGGYGPPTARMVELAFRKKGCAFSYTDVPLWHFQSNLDVHLLSSRPIRYDKKSNKVVSFRQGCVNGDI